MEKRVLLAVFLSFLVLFIYQALFVAPPDQPSPADVAEPGSASTASRPAPPAPRATPPAEAPELPPTAEPAVGDTELRDIFVEADRIRAVFSNQGAVLVSWQLKDYLEDGSPVELVPRGMPPVEPWPFSLELDDPGATARLEHAFFKPSRDHVRVERVPDRLVFEFEDTGGLRARKTFGFDPGSPYTVSFSAEVTLDGTPLTPRLRWGPALGGVGTERSRYRQGPRGLFYGRMHADDVLSELDVERITPSSAARLPSYRGRFEFAGVDNHYFAGVALLKDSDAEVRYRSVAVPPGPGSSGEGQSLIAFDLALADLETPTPFFLGPKDFDVLAAVEPSLVRAIDFGMLAWLVVPLHRSLKWVHGYVGNYGWSIIILTVLINLVIFPLRHKSVVSMRKMQELQPEMKAIQGRYAHLKTTDPAKQKMNQEVMDLYRQRGVNPAGGCLPMLLTMPILFAFYRLLSAAIEIRGAPFMFWIKDLSAHDPFYVTPLIMGATMVLQQQMTPSAADPTQQKIMMIMPVVFTFMFLWFPSGLVLYWLTSNVLGIVQQSVTNRIIGPAKVRTVRPAAERRVKKAGSEQPPAEKR